MTTTLEVPAIDAREMERQIDLFTLRAIHARDLMVDGAGTFSFFYGPITRRPGRVEIRQTAPGIYSVAFGHIDARTHTLIQDRVVADVAAENLRSIIRELA